MICPTPHSPPCSANKNTIRNHGQTLGFAFQAVVIGLMLGGSFYRLPGTPTGIQSLKTLCFQFEAGYFYLSVVYAIYRYSNELIVFDRERADHLYKPIPWILSEVTANLSVNIFFPALFSVILYFMAGMRPDSLAENLFIFIAAAVLVQLGSVSFALVSASLVREFASASLMANGTSIFFFLSIGYALLQPPVYVNWIRFINVYWYGFRIAALSQFHGRVFSCEGVTGLAANQCTGDQVLAGLLIPASDPLWKYFVPLIGLVIGFNALATVILAVGFWGNAPGRNFGAECFPVSIGTQVVSSMRQELGPTKRCCNRRATWTLCGRRSMSRSEGWACRGSGPVVLFCPSSERGFSTMSTSRVQRDRSRQSW